MNKIKPPITNNKFRWYGFEIELSETKNGWNYTIVGFGIEDTNTGFSTKGEAIADAMNYAQDYITNEETETTT